MNTTGDPELDKIAVLIRDAWQRALELEHQGLFASAERALMVPIEAMASYIVKRREEYERASKH